MIIRILTCKKVILISELSKIPIKYPWWFI